MSGLSFHHASPFYEMTALYALAAIIDSVGLLPAAPIVVERRSLGLCAIEQAISVHGNISIFR